MLVYYEYIVNLVFDLTTSACVGVDSFVRCTPVIIFYVRKSVVSEPHKAFMCINI